MKRLIIVLVLLLSTNVFAEQFVLYNVPVEVLFSPKGGCTEAVIKEIDMATQSLYVCAYSFTSPDIARAIARAQERNVKVLVLVDKDQSQVMYSMSTFLYNMQVPVYVPKLKGLQHNKVIVIDDKTIITGSFNFSAAAEKSNAENLIVIKDPAIARLYTNNVAKLLRDATAFKPQSASVVEKKKK